MSYAKFEHTWAHQNINLWHQVYLFVCVCRLQAVPFATFELLIRKVLPLYCPFFIDLCLSNHIELFV